MSNVKLYDPFREVERFFDEGFPSFFAPVKRYFGPPMDVYQTDKDVVVEFQVPKMDPSKLDISVENGVLKVQAEHQEDKKEEGKEYFHREIRRGGFLRMLSLPVDVKSDQTEAVYENGVLRITLPKADAAKSHRVEVKVK